METPSISRTPKRSFLLRGGRSYMKMEGVTAHRSRKTYYGNNKHGRPALGRPLIRKMRRQGMLGPSGFSLTMIRRVVTVRSFVDARKPSTRVLIIVMLLVCKKKTCHDSEYEKTCLAGWERDVWTQGAKLGAE